MYGMLMSILLLLLDSIGGVKPSFLSFLFAIMFNSFLAVIVGTGLGSLMCVAGQKHLNHLATQSCQAQPDYHRLVTMTSWVGDAKYCMHIRYLGE